MLWKILQYQLLSIVHSSWPSAPRRRIQAQRRAEQLLLEASRRLKQNENEVDALDGFLDV